MDGGRQHITAPACRSGMRSLMRGLVAGGIAAGLLASSAGARTLVVNANGYTLDDKGGIKRFDRLQIGDDGRIEALYQRGDKLPKGLKLDRQVEAGGKTLIPGLIDAHAHVMALGLQALGLNLGGAATLEAALEKLRAHAARDKAAAWIEGAGWNQEDWSLGRFPTAAELDRVVADRPAALVSVDGHALWVNSRALAIAGINARTADPAGGRIERDAAGRPTGVLVDAAMDLVRRHVPPPHPRTAEAALSRALAILAASGVTMVHDAGTQADDWALYRRFGDERRLTVRIYAMAAGPEALARIAPVKPTPWLYDDRLVMRAVSFVSDGALGSRGAWLLQPYGDAPALRGLSLLDDTRLRNRLSRVLMDGFQPAVDAIGDGANRQLLDAYQELSATYGDERRWRIEHAQILDPADLPRLADYGIYLSMQPGHAPADRTMATQRLGEARLAGAHAWKSLLGAGARIAFGSDAPAMSADPFFGIHAAVTRQTRDGQPAGGWRPQEAVTFQQALAAYTTGAARAAFAEDKVGTLAKGKWADFVLLDRDPFTVPAGELWRVKVLTTFVGGQVVFSEGRARQPNKP